MIRRQITDRIDSLLADVHSMLRLPIETDPGLKGGCNLSAALILLSVVAGLSAEIYRNDQPRRIDQSGGWFKKVLADFYPWEQEETLENAILREHAANVLYEAFRNPLVHSLGVFEGSKYGRLKVAKGSLEESEIESIERADSRPNWDRLTLYTDSSAKAERTKTILTLKHFYWGVRKTIYRVVEDRLRQDLATGPVPRVIAVEEVTATATATIVHAYRPENTFTNINSGSTHRVEYEPKK